MTSLSRRNFLRSSLLGSATAGALTLAGCGDTTSSTSVPENTVEIAFNHGVASGDADQTSLIIWTRVTPANDGLIKVRWQVASDAAMTDVVAVGIAEVSPARDFTVKVLVEGLTPGTEYYYSFADTQKVSPIGKTKTAPQKGAKAMKMAVVSCSNYQFGLFNAYRAISERDDVDAVLHLGDYFYEYGTDGYGGDEAKKLGRFHDPITEVVNLTHYRLRHAQYKSDADLQAAHAAAPWYCGWDDHESANDSYATGAENHQEDLGEGEWSARKAAAVQAYLEWMPVRDPKPGRTKEAIYRSFDFGDLATLIMLETRLTGRTKPQNYGEALKDVSEEEAPAKIMALMADVQSQERSMLGIAQEEWAAAELKKSTKSGKAWQIIGNQVVMAPVKLLKFRETMSEEELSALLEEMPFLAPYVALAEYGLPLNLDAWDGYPASRERLLNAAEASGARVIALAGDTHTAWANNLKTSSGKLIGVEFAGTSVTSPGLGNIIPVEGLGEAFVEDNDAVVYHNPYDRGFLLLTLTPEEATGDFITISTVESEAFETRLDARLTTSRQGDELTPLRHRTLR